MSCAGLIIELAVYMVRTLASGVSPPHPITIMFGRGLTPPRRALSPCWFSPARAEQPMVVDGFWEETGEKGPAGGVGFIVEGYHS